MDDNTSDSATNQMVYTKKELKSMLMPLIGTIINTYKVIYNNLGKLRFTASYNETPPELHENITIEDKIYEVGYIDIKKKVFTATLKNIIQETPPVNNQQVTKVI